MTRGTIHKHRYRHLVVTHHTVSMRGLPCGRITRGSGACPHDSTYDSECVPELTPIRSEKKNAGWQACSSVPQVKFSSTESADTPPWPHTATRSNQYRAYGYPFLMSRQHVGASEVVSSEHCSPQDV